MGSGSVGSKAGVWSMPKLWPASKARWCWGGPRAGEGWQRGGQAQVAQDAVRGLGCGDEGEAAHVGAAAGGREGAPSASVRR